MRAQTVKRFEYFDYIKRLCISTVHLTENYILLQRLENNVEIIDTALN